MSRYTATPEEMAEIRRALLPARFSDDPEGVETEQEEGPGRLRRLWRRFYDWAGGDATDYFDFD